MNSEYQTPPSRPSIILVNTNGKQKSCNMATFRTYKRPGNFKLDENTAVYCPIKRPIAGVQRISRHFGLVPSDCPFQIPDVKQTSNINNYYNFFVLKFERVLDYYLLNSYSSSYLF